MTDATPTAGLHPIPATIGAAQHRAITIVLARFHFFKLRCPQLATPQASITNLINMCPFAVFF